MSILRIENLSREFGGIHAVEDLNYDVEPGNIHSIIGPNGAGKTTLFNLVTGIYKPSGGRVLLNDQLVSNLPPFELAAKGVSRTFQNLQIFFNMKAIENVLVGAHLQITRGFLASLFHLPNLTRSERAARERCAELMNFVGLGSYLDADANSMPYGALKRLEIARALAAKPKLLLLDEPAAGLNGTESGEIAEVIKKIAVSGVTVVLVEHDMKMVMNISDHILVMDHGRKLAEGTPKDVRDDPDVIKAYLGENAP